jgi:hypothetical protein
MSGFHAPHCPVFTLLLLRYPYVPPAPRVRHAAPQHTSTRDLVVVVDVLVAHVKQILGAVAPRQRLVADLQVRVFRRLVHVLVLPAHARRADTSQPRAPSPPYGAADEQGGRAQRRGTHEASQFRKTPATKTVPTPVIFFHSSTSSATTTRTGKSKRTRREACVHTQHPVKSSPAAPSPALRPIWGCATLRASIYDR